VNAMWNLGLAKNMCSFISDHNVIDITKQNNNIFIKNKFSYVFCAPCDITNSIGMPSAPFPDFAELILAGGFSMHLSPPSP
jgi:hypothetical protein